MLFIYIYEKSAQYYELFIVIFILAHLFPYSGAAGKSETPKYSVSSD